MPVPNVSIGLLGPRVPSVVLLMQLPRSLLRGVWSASHNRSGSGLHAVFVIVTPVTPALNHACAALVSRLNHSLTTLVWRTHTTGASSIEQHAHVDRGCAPGRVEGAHGRLME